MARITAEISEAEQDGLVKWITDTFPAAAALRQVRLEAGEIHARLDTPAGVVRAEIRLQVEAG